MTAADTELERAWRQVVGQRRQRGADDAWERLLGRHREPHRHYHTATHVRWVIRHLRELWPADASDDDLRVALAAALFHDAVYDPRSSANERHSADLAAQVLGELGWDAAQIERVRMLIQATADHTTHSDDPALDVLLDADLAVLGAEPAVYKAYVRGVRAEYGELDDTAWHRGRAAVLRALLSRSPLYRTEAMRAARERRARANLTAELSSLERSVHM